MFEWYRRWKYKKDRFWRFYESSDDESIRYETAIKILKGKYKNTVFSITPKMLEEIGKFTYEWSVDKLYCDGVLEHRAHPECVKGWVLNNIIDDIVEVAMNEIIKNYRDLREQVNESEQEDRTNYSEESTEQRTVRKKGSSISSE